MHDAKMIRVLRSFVLDILTFLQNTLKIIDWSYHESIRFEDDDEDALTGAA